MFVGEFIENDPKIPPVKQSENKLTEQKTLKKVDDPRCLLNTNESDIPRNKRCPVSNMKFKQCCGKLA